MNTTPQWALLLTFFLSVAGLRDVGLHLSTLLDFSASESSFIAYQYWFGAGAPAFVGLLKGATAFIAWSRPRRCRIWFVVMTLGIVVSALLRSSFGARLWFDFYGGPPFLEAMTTEDWRTSIVGMLAASAPYFGVVAFLFSGERRSYFAYGEVRRAGNLPRL